MKILTTISLLVLSHLLFAQATIINGPDLENDRDSKMNRMLNGDDNSFYTYRIRSKGKGTTFIVEKYDKSTLKPSFSKEVNLDEERKTKIEDVEYAKGNVFIFRRQYDKKADKMSLFYQTVSSNGEVSENLKEVISINSDHYEFVNFDIYPNPSNTKFLIKASHKPDKYSAYQTDFILMDAANQKKLWTKTVDERLFTNTEGKTINFYGAYTGTMIDLEDVGFIGLHFDDNDNVYFGYTSPAKLWSNKEERYKLSLGILNANDNDAKYVELTFDDDYFVRDVEFSKSNNNEIVVGGYIKDVQERKGRDLIKVGIFSFSIDLNSNQIKSKSVKLFDDELLTRLESSSKRARKFKYKLDYIFPIGEDVYYVGEQYKEEMVIRYQSNSSTAGGIGTMAGMRTGGTRVADVDWEYEYMDVIVAKLNSKGEFEWVKNLPLRQVMKLENSPHVFKQYIAVASSENIYVMCDDHPKNIERYAKADFEAKDLKSVFGIHGSDFVCNQLNIKTGEIKRVVLMKNDDYCFAPIQERNPSFMPPSDCEIFIPGKNNEIFIYTEDRGRDRFAKIKFE
jgi:hypothetical protein